MKKAKYGDWVTVIYDGVLSDGKIFESSDDSGPLEFQIGNDSVLPAFENSIIDMAEGETKTIQLGPEQAYGQKNDNLIQTISRKELDVHIDPKPGMVLGLTVEKDGESHKVPAMITEVTEDNLTIDYNHPLAGKTLIFHITLQTIKRSLPSIDTACAPPRAGGSSCSCSGCGN